MSQKSPVQFVEVAPRDGFQSILQPIGLGKKISIIDGLASSGFKRMEIGSFVSPDAIPQMADMTDVMDHFRNYPGILSALVPNTRGAEIARASGCKAFVFVFSVSETHNRSNVRRSVSASLAELHRLAQTISAIPGAHLRVDIATAFDCPYEGRVAPESVLRAVEAVISAAPGSEIALCDTTGAAGPDEVADRFRMVMRETTNEVTWAFHGHDTFGTGVANAMAAYNAGVRVFDGSASGLGGCPFAPGASGNTATEDLVYCFERCGIDTGIDIDALLVAADEISDLSVNPVAGHLKSVARNRVSQLIARH